MAETKKTRKASTPDTRAADGKKTVAGVRRKYKVDVNKRRKLLPGEIKHVANMVVVLKLAGYTRSQMAKVIGISKGQIKEMLEAPDAVELLTSLRERLPQAAIDLLQGYMIEAVQVYVEIIRSSTDDKLRKECADAILDRGGAPKASRQERLQTNDNRTTFTDEGIVERLRTAPVAVQEQAAQLIESLETLLATASETANEEEDAETN